MHRKIIRRLVVGNINVDHDNKVPNIIPDLDIRDESVDKLDIYYSDESDPKNNIIKCVNS